MEVVGTERRQTQQTFGGKLEGWFVGINEKGGVKDGAHISSSGRHWKVVPVTEMEGRRRDR